MTSLLENLQEMGIFFAFRELQLQLLLEHRDFNWKLGETKNGKNV